MRAENPSFLRLFFTHSPFSKDLLGLRVELFAEFEFREICSHLMENVNTRRSAPSIKTYGRPNMTPFILATSSNCAQLRQRPKECQCDLLRAQRAAPDLGALHLDPAGEVGRVRGPEEQRPGRE